jgi:peptidoglycan/xylan/chitin deacetylase (PgdA/CDA1 family)
MAAESYITAAVALESYAGSLAPPGIGNAGVGVSEMTRRRQLRRPGTFRPGMGHVPDHVVARRDASRARRRRRQTAVLGSLVMGLIAASAIVIVSMSETGRQRPRSQARPRVLSATPVARRQRLSLLEARGNATIRRLAALALPVYCAGSHGRALSFTFDDGPGIYTHYAVKKLARAHEQATFFVVGKSIEAWPGGLVPELRVGTLGDHTFTHTDLLGLPPAQVASELAGNQRLIERESGQPVDLFRPPYGAQDRTVNHIAKRLGLLDIMWSMDSRDSLGANWAGIIRNVEPDLRPGAIILMHENRGQTIRALTTLLSVLHRRHLRSVSLPDLFATDPPSRAQIRRGLAACLGRPARSGELAGAA